MKNIITLFFLFSTFFYSFCSFCNAAQIISFNDVQKRADAGSAEDQYIVAHCYETAKEVKQDLEKAFFYYTKSALQNYAPAQSNLGSMYERGLGTKIDEKKAFFWYLKAAKLGFAPAQFNIGLCYYKAKGTNTNLVEAYTWISIAQLITKDSYPQFAQAKKNLESQLSFNQTSQARDLISKRIKQLHLE